MSVRLSKRTLLVLLALAVCFWGVSCSEKHNNTDQDRAYALLETAAQQNADGNEQVAVHLIDSALAMNLNQIIPAY